MHNLDRVQLENSTYAGFEDDEFEYEYEYEYEVESGQLDDAEETELAGQLLAVADEDELEQFLGKVIKKFGKRAVRSLNPAIGGPLGSIVQSAARSALPRLGAMAGGAIGQRFGHSRLGSRIGRSLARRGIRYLGFEYESDHAPDPETEFEVAKQVVRFTADATRRAANQPAASPKEAAAKAAIAAARKPSGQAAPPSVVAQSGQRSGRWVRRGRNVVLIGL